MAKLKAALAPQILEPVEGFIPIGQNHGLVNEPIAQREQEQIAFEAAREQEKYQRQARHADQHAELAIKRFLL